MPNEFFEEQLPGSKIKSLIVSTYFKQWAKIIGKYADKIGYIDMFCGPGTYEDGTDSTPLLVLKAAIADDKLKKTLVTVFNDKEPKNIEKLKEEVERLNGVSEMKYKPYFDIKAVGEEFSRGHEKGRAYTISHLFGPIWLQRIKFGTFRFSY